jgi:group II intron reverse transcriptase/maturase
MHPTVTIAQYIGESLSGLHRIREAVERGRKDRFTSLHHHISIRLLTASYYNIRKDAAIGIDGLTWQEYGTELAANIGDLHKRVQTSRYRALPSKRIWIPKGNAKMRPIGIQSIEDKIVQQALVWILEIIYEAEFVGFSYGFRSGKNCHNALDAIYVAITQRAVNWILDADIKSFFDTVSHHWLMEFIKHRIADSRILRLINKILRAGVSEDGEWSRTTVGTPQGAIISPMLSNIYMHYVLDLWIQKWRKTKANGEVYIVRYADDWITGFQYESDAVEFKKLLHERLSKFGLELQEEKTRLIEFGGYAIPSRKAAGNGAPETFNFLGFTHICSTNPKTGRFQLKRQTIAKRLHAKVNEISRELRKRMYQPIELIGKWLRVVMVGYFNYYSVPDNRRACWIFRGAINRVWLKVMRRRSQRGKKLTWEKFNKTIKQWIPELTILHPYPNQRLIVNPK